MNKKCVFLFVLFFLNFTLAESSVPQPVFKWQNGGWSYVEFNKAYYTSPATLDVNNDGIKDIIWANYKVFAFNGKNGNEIWWFYAGTDLSNPLVRNNIYTHCSVIVADITGDGNENIVTAHSNGMVCAYYKSGYFLPGFPTQPTGRTDRIASLSVYDLDNDGNKEIIIGWAIANNLNVCVLEHNGNVRTGWPQYVPNENTNALGIYNDNIAVGDITGDGFGEIIVPSDTGKTCAYYRNATPLPVNPVFSEYLDHTKWPHVVNYEDYENEKIGYSPDGNFYMGTDQPATITDLEENGTYEIVIVGQVFTKVSQTNLYTSPFIYNIDRTRYNHNSFNWENNLPKSGSPLSNDWNVIPIKTTNPVVVDIDGNGYKEILSSSYDGKLHCYWLDRTEHHSWPYSVYNSSEGVIRFSSEPAVADLDGNGQLEIIFTSWPQYYSSKGGHLFILNAKGELLYKVTLPYGENGQVGSQGFDGCLAAPTIDDIDGDGELEILLGAVYAGMLVYDLPGAGGGDLPWPTGRHDYARTGYIHTAPDPPAFINYPSLDCDGYYSVTWGTVAGVTGYELQRATLPDFSNSTTIYSGPLTSFNETGILIGTYYYRVRTLDFSVYSTWTEGGAILVSSPPGSFSYLSPANSSTNISPFIDLDWSDSSAATSYDVYFGTNNPPPKLTTVTESIYSPSQLNENTAYYWKVVAKNACGQVSGEIWSFTTGNSSWERINYNNSSQVIGGNQDTNLIDEVTSDSGALGLWTYYNNNNWQRLNFKDPQCLALGDIDQDGKEEIIAGFSGLGIWVYDVSLGWRRISWNTPQAIMCGDLDGNGKDEVVIDSGTSGIWSYDNNSSWRKLNNGNPDCMACGDINNDGLDELIASFGSIGVWVYNIYAGWQKIDNRNAEEMVCGDLDNNGYDEVIGDFGSLGILVYLNDSTWVRINWNNSKALTCGDFDNDGKEEIVTCFASLGIWIFHYPGCWNRVNWNSVGDLCCGDLDNNGSLELIGDFNTYGLWAYYFIR